MEKFQGSSFKKEKILDFLNQQSGNKHFKMFIEDYKNYLLTNELNFDNLQLLEAEEKETLSGV